MSAYLSVHQCSKKWSKTPKKHVKLKTWINQRTGKSITEPVFVEYFPWAYNHKTRDRVGGHNSKHDYRGHKLYVRGENKKIRRQARQAIAQDLQDLEDINHMKWEDHMSEDDINQIRDVEEYYWNLIEREQKEQEELWEQREWENQLIEMDLHGEDPFEYHDDPMYDDMMY